MLTIDRAITEAQAEETAEREVNKAMERKAPAPVNNVTIPLDEYISLYNSTDKYCRLLGIISGLVRVCAYRTDKIRITDDEEILEFIKYNEMDVYAEMCKHTIENEERGEDV